MTGDEHFRACLQYPKTFTFERVLVNIGWNNLTTVINLEGLYYKIFRLSFTYI